MKKYSTPPINFLGHKRHFLPEILKLADKARVNEYFIDVFGGSGIIAHNLKYTFPSARVIFNDYDDYMGRITQAEKLNQLKLVLLEETKMYADEERISAPDTLRLQSIIREHGFEGDRTVLSWFFFGGVVSSREKTSRQFYKNISKKLISADGYCEGVEIRREDYTKYLSEKAFFILDPPYYFTSSDFYEKTLNLYEQIYLIDWMMNTNFIYFCSEKTGMQDYIKNKYPNIQYFTKLRGLNYSSKYTDYMFYNIK